MSTAPPELLLWDPYENAVTDNVVEDSRIADLALGLDLRRPRRPGQLLRRQHVHHLGAR